MSHQNPTFVDFLIFKPGYTSLERQYYGTGSNLLVFGSLVTGPETDKGGPGC